MTLYQVIISCYKNNIKRLGRELLQIVKPESISEGFDFSSRYGNVIRVDPVTSIVSAGEYYFELFSGK